MFSRFEFSNFIEIFNKNEILMKKGEEKYERAKTLIVLFMYIKYLIFAYLLSSIAK